MSESKADRAGLEIIAHERASQILASRVDMMPGSLGHPVRLQRRQEHLIDLIKQAAKEGAQVHLLRQDIQRPSGDETKQAEYDASLEAAILILEVTIAALIIEATQTELQVDTAVFKSIKEQQ
jgi:hypothetical protein